MEHPPFTIDQNIFKASHSTPIRATTWPLGGLTRKILDDFLDTTNDGVIGIAPAYGTNSVLSLLAFASSSKVLVVQLANQTKGKKAKGRNFLEELLLSPSLCRYAFQMDVLATSLYWDLKLRIRSAVDLLSVSRTDDRYSTQAIMNALGGEVDLHKENLNSLFRGGENLDGSTLREVALQAWVAWRAASLDQMTARLNEVPRIDTSTFDETRLAVFAKMVRETRCLEALKPTSIANEIADDYIVSGDKLQVTCTRFKNRVRAPGDRIQIEFSTSQGQRRTVSGKASTVNGRGVEINLSDSLPPIGSIKITTIGKEPLTEGERQRVNITLEALQGTSTIADKPFFQAIWLPQETPSWSEWSTIRVPVFFTRPLNDSQTQAVEAIVSPEPITIIQGPPGTGKTTVIAAAVMSISLSFARGRTVWLVAQSNVAVKNIAEKLASVDFLDFKLLVSKDFHYDWHEHLYDKINPNLIRSDTFPNSPVEAERLLMGTTVILCTLSMLSNLRISIITRLVPLETVIVDEASQVEMGNFVPMISLYSTSLRKLVFIGDDKQYRMPRQLGLFIGNEVYDSKLKTIHPIATPCCSFVDVKRSKESSRGFSWIVCSVPSLSPRTKPGIERGRGLGCDPRGARLRE
ncbi:hypothetical protein B0H16DRAFT_1304711 [Mycena metata]|uniref:DNA2/NAM7 helicase helicase domain-containing protein n=1 Tax=Mycena metata TaxID=1033252 RepID=A0AAD7JZ62_9AGAR|nr:hypothetical protein B0H16DRAFT_1304711 [Mycena metata]